MSPKAKRLIVIAVTTPIGMLALGMLWLSGAGRSFQGDLDEVADGYFYFSGKRMIAPNPRDDDSPAIPGDIISFEVSGDYILASRFSHRHGEIRYWILDSKRHAVRGDMTRDQFLAEAEASSISAGVVARITSATR